MLTVYEPGVQTDLLVLNWWAEMGQNGDLEQAFSVTLAPCGAFMTEMQRTTLVYEADEQGIWFSAWFDRSLSAGFYGLWIRSDKRHNVDALVQVIESLHFGLSRFPVLIFATMNLQVIEQAKRFGFQTMGTIPHLFDGIPATIAWLDEEHFYPAIAQYAHLFDQNNPPILQEVING